MASMADNGFPCLTLWQHRSNDHAFYDHDNPAASDALSPSFSSEGQPLQHVAPTMQRYLLESQRPLFSSSLHHDHQIPAHLPHDSSANGCYDIHSDAYIPPTIPCVASPLSSGIESSCVSGCWSEPQYSPYPSPSLAHSSCRSSLGYIDTPVSYDNQLESGRHDSLAPEWCVTMQDVQKLADCQPEFVPFDDEPVEFAPYSAYAFEDHQPLPSGNRRNYEIPDCIPRRDSHEEIGQRESSQLHSEQPVIRRRRAQRVHGPSSSSSAPTRVSKRPSPGRRTSSHHLEPISSNTAEMSPVTTETRAFPCPLAVYGCDSSFSSKNEWKRHVNTQHMRLGFWRCDQCTSPHGDRKPNDFNRKDLFTQHVRRMHLQSEATRSKKAKNEADEEMIQRAAVRCYRRLRSPPEQTGCLSCGEQFLGEGAWDERMEHVGRHMEIAKKDNSSAVGPEQWGLDELAQAWMVKEGILKQRGMQLLLEI